MNQPQPGTPEYEAETQAIVDDFRDALREAFVRRLEAMTSHPDWKPPTPVKPGDPAYGCIEF